MKVVKRLAALMLCLALISGSMTADATGSQPVSRTESVYQTIKAGGVGGTMVVTGMYDNTFGMGTMEADGQTAWQPYDSEIYPTLFGESEWTVASSECCESSCPYYEQHQSNTVCPWQMIWKETFLQTSTGKTFGPYYTSKQLNVGGSSILLCPVRRSFVSPENLRRTDASGRFFSVKGENGCWGVYDTASDRLTVDYLYEDIQPVEESGFVKVQLNDLWGAVDAATGVMMMQPTYQAFDLYSVTEELRRVDTAGNYAVFNEYNEQISSVVYACGTQDTAYYPPIHILQIGTKWYDLNGALVWEPDGTHTLEFVQDDCLALRTYAMVNDKLQFKNMALTAFEGQPQPDDTILQGDVDLNGIVNSADARDELKASVGLMTLTPRKQLAGDLDGIGIASSVNARRILALVTL